MTDIERAEADGVDKGIAMEPTANRGAGRETGRETGREADSGVGRESDFSAARRPGREADSTAARTPGREVDSGADRGVGRDAGSTVGREAGPVTGSQGDPEHGTRAGRHPGLVPAGERDVLEGRLRHALTGFVDEPRAAVEEADHVLEDLTAHLAETLAGHRRTLRTSWQGATEDTEQLRQALRDYRETAERLLSL